MLEKAETFSCELLVGNALSGCWHHALVLSAVLQQWRGSGHPQCPRCPCLSRTSTAGLRKVLSHPPVSLSLHRWACCPWLSPQGFLAAFGLGWSVGRRFAHLDLATSPAPPRQAGSGEGIDCYWIVLLGFWHLQASHTSCVCQLVIPNPRMGWAVWSYTAAALHLPLTCFMFVPSLLWWEQGDLGRLTATRALLSNVEVLTGCFFWKEGIYVQ